MRHPHPPVTNQFKCFVRIIVIFTDYPKYDSRSLIKSLTPTLIT